MAPELRIGALIVGAVLLLLAVFGSRLLGRAGAPWIRLVLAVAGAALLGWALTWWYPSSRMPSPPAAAAAPVPAPLSVDLVDAASSALQECPRGTPPAVPNGATASRQEIMAARAAFQAYDTATNSYVHCVDATIERVSAQYPNAPPTDLQELKAFGVRNHDTAIDQEQALADQFNAQIRTYKAKHPQSQ